MNKWIKIVGVIAVLIPFITSCTGAKEVVLDESPEVKVMNPTWTEIVPGQEDGVRKMVVFLPVENEIENYAIDSIFFKGYHEKLTYKSKSRAGKGYQAVIELSDPQSVIIPPFELDENQALVSYFDATKSRRYFRVSNFKKAESIFMP